MTYKAAGGRRGATQCMDCPCGLDVRVHTSRIEKLEARHESNGIPFQLHSGKRAGANGAAAVGRAPSSPHRAPPTSSTVRSSALQTPQRARRRAPARDRRQIVTHQSGKHIRRGFRNAWAMERKCDPSFAVARIETGPTPMPFQPPLAAPAGVGTSWTRATSTAYSATRAW